MGSPEEIAWRLGWIDDSKLKKLSKGFVTSGYGTYLKQILKESSSNNDFLNRNLSSSESLDKMKSILPEYINKVLVTGGAGFIGINAIIKLLKESNAKIYNLDKLSYASDLFGLKIY